VLKHLRPNKDEINFIAIEKGKAVTLFSLLPYVYDSYFFIGVPDIRCLGAEASMTSVNHIQVT